MFSGIVEQTGELLHKEHKASNLILTIRHTFEEPLYIDQSISHNGVCLTVIDVGASQYKVAAIKETLARTNLGLAEIGDFINLERSIRGDTRLDGHVVQGHVDCTGKVESIEDKKGSWRFRISFPNELNIYTIEKGSVAINGISLTVSALFENGIAVDIIPYTFNHTNLKYTRTGDLVNIEFDPIGKYVIRYMEKIKP